MLFENTDDVGHPVDRVFGLLRDEMPLIVPYLNDVEEIIIEEREDKDGGDVRIVNLWRASHSKVPRLVQKFIKPDMLCWKDYALWHPSGPPRAEWRLEPKVGGSLFTCTGQTSIVEKEPGKSCQIKVEGDLRVYPENVPGVPRLLAGKMRSKIESFVVAMLVPNMQTLAHGVQAYFDDMDSGMGDVPLDE